MKRIILYLSLAFSFILFFTGSARAQRFSVSTNAVEWLNLGTANVEASVAVSQHFSVHAGARINNWTYRKGDPMARLDDPTGEEEKQFENRKQAYNVGLRYWPWHIYSGWWGYVRAQYMEYNRGGLIRQTAEEGDAVGLGIGAGYTYMLTKNWNIEFGAGTWTGESWYTTYRCTNCGQKMEEGKKFFILPDDVFVSFIYVF